jgi:hypothetical protein
MAFSASVRMSWAPTPGTYQIPASFRLLASQQGVHRGNEGGPIAWLTGAKHRLRAIRIVKIQHARLHEYARRTEAHGVIRIALDLGGTACRASWRSR